MTNQYSIQCTCSNCGYHGQVSFDRGTEVPTIFECPNCGCVTASKLKSKPNNWQYPPGVRDWIQHNEFVTTDCAQELERIRGEPNKLARKQIFELGKHNYYRSPGLTDKNVSVKHASDEMW